MNELFGFTHLLPIGKVRKLKPRLDPLLQVIPRQHLRAVLVQLEAVPRHGGRGALLVQLGVGQRRLAPDRRLGRARADAGAQVRVREEPVVDLGAVDRVGAERRARDVGRGGRAEVGAAGSREGRDVEVPAPGEDAEGRGVPGSWVGEGEGGAHEGCEDLARRWHRVVARG